MALDHRTGTVAPEPRCPISRECGTRPLQDQSRFQCCQRRKALPSDEVRASSKYADPDASPKLQVATSQSVNTIHEGLSIISTE